MKRAAVLGAALVVAGCASVPAQHPTRPQTVHLAVPPVSTTTTSPLVSVGPGAAEAGLRQATRTTDGHVFLAAIDDNGFDSAHPDATSVQLRVYESTTTGIPTAFREVDPTHAPRAASGSSMSGVDTRIDRAGILHLMYYRTDTDRCVHQTFDPATGRYGPSEDVATGGRTASTPQTYYGLRAMYLCSMTLLGDDTPEVVVAGDDGVTAYHRGGSGWVSDGQLSTTPATHPSIVTDHQGRAQVAWLSHDDTIDWSVRSAAGGWSPPVAVASGNPTVMSNGNLDQGPSLAVDNADQPAVLWLSGHANQPDDRLRVAHRQADGSWVEQDPDIFAHAPGIHLRGDDELVVLGHDKDIHPGWIAFNGSSWTAPHPFTRTGALDGSSNTRFDPLRDPDPDVVDVTTMDDDSDTRGGYKPDLYYAAIQLPPVASSSAPALLRAPHSVTTGTRVTLLARTGTPGQRVTAQEGAHVLAVGRTGRDGRASLVLTVTRSVTVSLVSAAGTSVTQRISAFWKVLLHRSASHVQITVRGPGRTVRALVQSHRSGTWLTVRTLRLRPGHGTTISRPAGSWRVLVPGQSGVSATAAAG